MDDYLTVAQTAQQFNVSQDWVRKLCRRRLVVCLKPGRDWLIQRQSFKEYMDNPPKPGPKPRG